MTSSPFVSISTIVAQIWIQKRLSFHIFYDISLRYNDTSLKIGGLFMLTYFLNARGKESKYRFLYNAIRSDILAKKLLPGERLPSKRALAEHLGLSFSMSAISRSKRGAASLSPPSRFRKTATQTEQTRQTFNPRMPRKRLEHPKAATETQTRTPKRQSPKPNPPRRTAPSANSPPTSPLRPSPTLSAMFCSAFRVSCSRARKIRGLCTFDAPSAPICSAIAACRRIPRKS